MKNRRHRGLTLLGVLCVATAAGCVPARISQELRDARDVMADARQSPAVQFEPDQLLVAQRTLDRAEAAPNGSDREVELAYIADRQTRIAMANARRHTIAANTQSQQVNYQAELEALAHRRGEALEDTERALNETNVALTQQQREVARTREALNAEQRARAAAEERVQTAMDRLRALASVREDQGRTVITLSGEVLFESDRATLRPEARERLLAVADALRANPPGSVVVIEGHTDSRGSSRYNCDLSQRRASAVYDYLVGEGVPPDRMRAIGAGESQPIAPNEDSEGRANNRRVEVIIGPESSDVVAVACPVDMAR